MKFSFEYPIANQTETIEITISDDLVSRAQGFGYDLVSVETMAKAMITKFVDRITGTTFWTR